MSSDGVEWVALVDPDEITLRENWTGRLHTLALIVVTTVARLWYFRSNRWI